MNAPVAELFAILPEVSYGSAFEGESPQTDDLFAAALREHIDGEGPPPEPAAETGEAQALLPVPTPPPTRPPSPQALAPERAAFVPTEPPIDPHPAASTALPLRDPGAPATPPDDPRATPPPQSPSLAGVAAEEEAPPVSQSVPRGAEPLPAPIAQDGSRETARIADGRGIPTPASTASDAAPTRPTPRTTRTLGEVRIESRLEGADPSTAPEPEPSVSTATRDPRASLSDTPPPLATAPTAASDPGTSAPPVVAQAPAAPTPSAAAAPAPADPGVTTPPSAPESMPLQIEWLAQRGGGRARVELYPPQLGRVDLEVRMRGADVEVVIAVQEGSAHSPMLSQRDPLADALAARDLRLSSFDVVSDEAGLDREAPERRHEADLGASTSPGAERANLLRTPDEPTRPPERQPGTGIDVRI